MAEAPNKQLAMAQRIAATELRDHNDWADLYRDAVLRGDYDGSDGVRCALAAIIETTELAAKLAERHYESAGCHAMYKNAGHQFAQAFRAGDHLKGQDHE